MNLVPLNLVPFEHHWTWFLLIFPLQIAPHPNCLGVMGEESSLCSGASTCVSVVVTLILLSSLLLLSSFNLFSLFLCRSYLAFLKMWPCWGFIEIKGIPLWGQEDPSIHLLLWTDSWRVHLLLELFPFQCAVFPLLSPKQEQSETGKKMAWIVAVVVQGVCGWGKCYLRGSGPVSPVNLSPNNSWLKLSAHHIHGKKLNRSPMSIFQSRLQIR